LSSTTDGRAIAAYCTLFHAVSMRCEITTSLISKAYWLVVSLFRAFWEMASHKSKRQLRQQPSQLKPHARFTQNRETAQQRPISTTNAKSCLFHWLSKQRETVCNSQHITPGARR
jgi:hypothetical protein